jgi:hypothetical protein
MQFVGDTEFMKKKGAIWSSSNKHQRQRHDAEFTQQMHLDFAAVTNSNRAVQVRTTSVKRNDLVSVSVSSCLLPKGMKVAVLLEDPTAQKNLSPVVQTVTVLKLWLVETCRPDIADWVAETLHGPKVQRICGANVGANAFSLACSGKMERDQAFVSLPQGHVRTVFAPVGPPLLSKQMKPKSEREKLEGQAEPFENNSYFDVHGKATKILRLALTKEAERNGVPHAAPPPAADTQVVKLKWVPTRSDKNKEQCGMWHGAFAVRLGTCKGSTVLQECGLLRTWVEEQFAEPLLLECWAIALGRVGKRNPKHFLFILAGDIHDTNVDPPPPSTLSLDVTVACSQGDEDSCLRHSMASALTAMGFVSEAEVVAAKTSFSRMQSSFGATHCVVALQNGSTQNRTLSVFFWAAVCVSDTVRLCGLCQCGLCQTHATRPRTVSSCVTSPISIANDRSYPI